MHSRIFGIVETENNENYEEEKQTILEYTEDEIYENCSYWADYVSQDTDLKSDIEWLKENKFIEFTSDTIFKVRKDTITNYFEDKIAELKKLVNSIDNVDNLFNKKYELQQEIENNTGFKFLYCGFDIENADEFLEFIYYRLKDKTEMSFEIIKTWDYHF